MKKRVSLESQFHQQYIVQAPRKIPKKNPLAYEDSKKRVWIKATDYNESEYTMWEHKPNTFYVWFKNDTVPEEGEVVFQNFKITNMYRYRTLLRCVVILTHI